MSVSTPSPGLASTRLLLDALAGVTGLTVALAEQGPIPAVLVPASLVAAFLIDRPDRGGLPAAGAAALGLAGFGAAAWEAFGESEEARLLAGTHLLCYLLVPLLLQSKRPVDLGRMLILCILLTAMGSLLTNSIWLALGLGACLILSVWAMVALQWLKMSADAQQGTAEASPTRSLLGPSAYLAGVAAVAGAFLFAVVPRVWTGQLTMFNNFPLPGTEAEVGYSEKVKLGDIGTAMENDEVVLTVESALMPAGVPVRYDQSVGSAAPLLRGATMGRYEDGTWEKSASRATFYLRAGRSGAFRQDGFVRHTFRLEPVGTAVLFTPGDFAGVIGSRADGRQTDVLFEPVRFGVERPDNVPLTETFRYDVYCRDGEASPNPRVIPGAQVQRMLFNAVAAAKMIDQGLAATLDAYIRSEIPEYVALAADTTPSEKAAVIDTHLNGSGLFTYSLEKTVEDPSIDPVVDFLINRRSGHCEYYASAMTLLLRSQGVAARVVNGFKGGDWNEGRQRYEVRQLHAHAWVEVLEPSVGRWLAFDPTPAARDDQVAANSQSVRTRIGVWDSVRSLWYDGIFMTRGKQRQAIYEPIGRAFAATWQTLRDYPDVFRAYWTGGRTADGREATLLQLLAPLAVLAGVAALVFGLVRVVRRRRRVSNADEARKRRGDSSATRVAWFDAFLKTAERVSGRGRRAGDTPREYVENLRPDAERAASLGERLTPAFYAVRFGERPVSADEERRFAADVAALDQDAV